MEGIEPTTPRLQITCSGQLSYIGNIVPAFLNNSFPKGIAKIGIIFLSPKLFDFFWKKIHFLLQKDFSASLPSVRTQLFALPE